MENTCGMPEINIPEEMPDFNSPGNVGSWRQILEANIGRKVRLDIALGLDTPLKSVCGEIYFVGNSYVALISNCKVLLADVLGIKFACFE